MIRILGLFFETLSIYSDFAPHQLLRNLLLIASWCSAGSEQLFIKPPSWEHVVRMNQDSDPCAQTISLGFWKNKKTNWKPRGAAGAVGNVFSWNIHSVISELWFYCLFEVIVNMPYCVTYFFEGVGSLYWGQSQLNIIPLYLWHMITYISLLWLAFQGDKIVTF